MIIYVRFFGYIFCVCVCMNDLSSLYFNEDVYHIRRQRTPYRVYKTKYNLVWIIFLFILNSERYLQRSVVISLSAYPWMDPVVVCRVYRCDERCDDTSLFAQGRSNIGRDYIHRMLLIVLFDIISSTHTHTQSLLYIIIRFYGFSTDEES